MKLNIPKPLITSLGFTYSPYMIGHAFAQAVLYVESNYNEEMYIDLTEYNDTESFLVAFLFETFVDNIEKGEIDGN